MSERNEEVLALVRELLGKYPTVNSRQLYDKAVRVHPFLDEDGLRTFHARYVLPIRRAQAVAEGRPRKPRTPKPKPQDMATGAGGGEAGSSRRGGRTGSTEADRLRVRGVLLQFARELAAAETRAEIVGMISDIDRFVNQIMSPRLPAEPGAQS